MEKPAYITEQDWNAIRRLPAHLRLIAELMLLPPEAHSVRDMLLSYLALEYESGTKLTAKSVPALIQDAVNHCARKDSSLPPERRAWLNRIYDAIQHDKF